MLQAITTKYLGPTDHRGSRIKARCAAGSVTVPWDYALNADANHVAAARALCEKLQWPYEFESGRDHNQNGVHVLRPDWGIRVDLTESEAEDLYEVLEACQVIRLRQDRGVSQRVMDLIDGASTERIIRRKECGQGGAS